MVVDEHCASAAVPPRGTDYKGRPVNGQAAIVQASKVVARLAVGSRQALQQQCLGV